MVLQQTERTGKWFLGKVKRPFAGLCSYQTVYFSQVKAMREHWFVFDGINTIRGMHTHKMKDCVESMRNEKGLPLEADAEKTEEIHAFLQRIGFYE
jgi:hypothetical protein